MTTTTAGRIRPLAFEAVRPLGIRVPPPAPGESLLGYITRILALTPVHHTMQGLTLAGIGRINPYSLATTIEDKEIEGLAILFGLPRESIVAMTHRRGTFAHSNTETINFFGVRIRADYREKRVRRVSPRALAKPPYHHRAIWDLRIFSFDPETREQLLDRCPECRKPLGWMRALGTQYCDHCRGENGLPSVFLPDYPQPTIEVADQEALDFVTGLVDPDPERRRAARRMAKGVWAKLHEEILFESAVAFACTLTMAPSDRPGRKRLERPKDVHEYARFTPEVLASAGRTIIGWPEAFFAIADKIRSEAAKRSGHYGVQKELGPLVGMTVDQHLPREVKALVRDAIAADMERTKDAAVVRRVDYARPEDWMPLDTLAAETGHPRKSLARLAASGFVPVRRAKVAPSPVLMQAAAVLPLLLQFRDAAHERYAAGTLAVKPHVLADLVARGLVTQLHGPVLGMFKTRDSYFSKSSVEALAKSIFDRARAVGEVPAAGMRISKAVKRLGMTPVPWGAVIAAIVKGDAEVFVYPGENKNWRTGLGVVDMREFARAVKAEIRSSDAAAADEWVGNQVVAEMLGVTEVVVWHLAKAGKISRRGWELYRQFNRNEIEEFGRRYCFTPEIQRRAGISRARDVRAWLEARGVETAFRLKEQGDFGYLREDVERVMAEEQRASKIAAE